MLTNDFGNPFLARSLLQFRGNMATPFLAVQNDLDGFALSFHTGKTHLPHLSPLPQPIPQLHTHHPLQHPTRSHHPIHFFHPSQYSLHTSHYPRMYAGATAAAAAAAAAAALEQSIPFSRHVMAVAPSLAKAFLPHSFSMKNSDAVGVGTLGFGFHGGLSDNNNSNDDNNNRKDDDQSDNSKGMNDCNDIELQSMNSPTIEYLPRVEDGSKRITINQPVKRSTNECIDIGTNSAAAKTNTNTNNSNSNNNILLFDGLGSVHDPHRNVMFYPGREKSERGRKIFLCPQCHYVTDRKNNLKRHIITMHQDCPKILECCGVVFRSKAMLREHVTLFHSSGYRCQVCGRNFCRKALLRRHLSVHSGQKDFICPLCSYATSHKSNLERHQKVHNKKNTLNESGVSSLKTKGLGENLSKMSVLDEMPDNSFDDDTPPPLPPTHQLYTSNESDTSLYRSTPIEAVIPRIKKFLLPDRLNQTYTDTRNPRLSSDSVNNEKSIAIQMINNPEEGGRNSDAYHYVYKNDSNVNGDKYHLYTHHHHHHLHQINATVTSLQMADNHQSPLSGKIIKRKPPRIFMTSYKCIDCRKVFSHQSLLNSHSCINARPSGEGYLSIVRPLAKKQPVKQIMTLASQSPTTSTAVVVVSTSVNDWSVNPFPTASIQSEHQKPTGSLDTMTEEKMVVLTPKSSCFSRYSPTLSSNICEKPPLNINSNQTVNSMSALVTKSTLKENDIMDIGSANNKDSNDSKTHDDEKSTNVDEYIKDNVNCNPAKHLEMVIEEEIVERKENLLNDHLDRRSKKDGDDTSYKMKRQKEDESEIEPKEDFKRNGKEAIAEITKKEMLVNTELSDNIKKESDITDHDDDNDVVDNNSNGLEEDRMQLPLKKRPVKEDDTEGADNRCHAEDQ